MRVNGPRRVVTFEFRQEAVALMERGGVSYGELSKRLGVSKSALYRWYREEMSKKAPRKKAPRKKAAPLKTLESILAPRSGESLEQRAARLEREVGRLQRENARLEDDQIILKKVAAFSGGKSE